jgi:hypothetical protein
MESDKIIIKFVSATKGLNIRYSTSTGTDWNLDRLTEKLLDSAKLQTIFAGTRLKGLHPRGSVRTFHNEQSLTTEPYHFICHRIVVGDSHVLDFYDGFKAAPVLSLVLYRDGFHLCFPEEQTLDLFQVVADTRIWPNKDTHWACQFCTYQNSYAKGMRPLCEHCAMHPLQKVIGVEKHIDDARLKAVTAYTGVQGEKGGVTGTEGNYRELNGHLRIEGIKLPDSLKKTFDGLKGVLDPSIYSEMHFGVSVPLYSGQVSRAQDREGSYRLVGGIKWFDFPAFTSSSAGDTPVFNSPDVIRFIFRWVSKSGHDIRMLSERSFKENEILFDTGLMLQEISRKEEGPITYIECEEVRWEGAAGGGGGAAAEAAAAGGGGGGGGARQNLAFPHANRSILALKVPQVLRF